MYQEGKACLFYGYARYHPRLPVFLCPLPLHKSFEDEGVWVDMVVDGLAMPPNMHAAVANTICCYSNHSCDDSGYVNCTQFVIGDDGERPTGSLSYPSRSASSTSSSSPVSASSSAATTTSTHGWSHIGFDRICTSISSGDLLHSTPTYRVVTNWIFQSCGT